MASVLLTGAAGFIGSHAAARFLADGHRVTGLDALVPGDPRLPRARLARLTDHPSFSFVHADVADAAALTAAFAAARPTIVVHLAARVGVRASIASPLDYVHANVAGFAGVLEACRRHGVGHLVYASSSSVYGLNATLPFSEHAHADHPVSVYAATKKADEMLAHAYASEVGLPCTGLRLFTVYGPWGRPDTALSLFADAITKGAPIDLFDGGTLERDFTYVDDVVECLARALDRPPVADAAFDPMRPDPARSRAPFRLVNVGAHRPERVSTVVALLERELGRSAITRRVPHPPADVVATCADTSDLRAWIGYAPHTPLEQGVPRFARWYREYNAC